MQWELVAGPDLLDLLNAAHDKKLPEPMVAYYFQQLINAVIFMHNNGFCHRDLKAENCVVDSTTQCVKVYTCCRIACIHVCIFTCMQCVHLPPQQRCSIGQLVTSLKGYSLGTVWYTKQRLA